MKYRRYSLPYAGYISYLPFSVNSSSTNWIFVFIHHIHRAVTNTTRIHFTSFLSVSTTFASKENNFFSFSFHFYIKQKKTQIRQHFRYALDILLSSNDLARTFYPLSRFAIDFSNPKKGHIIHFNRNSR